MGSALLSCASPTKTSPHEAPSSANPAASAARAHSALVEAWALVLRSQYASAALLFEQQRAAEPLQAGRGLAEIALKKGQLALGLTLIQEALASGSPGSIASPANASERKRLGTLQARIHLRQGQLDRALKTLDRATQNALPSSPPENSSALDESTLEALLVRAKILSELGQRDEGTTLFELILQHAELPRTSRPPSEATAPPTAPAEDPAKRAYLAGLAAFFLRDPETANDAFEQAEELSEPEPRPELLVSRARLFAERHDGPEALGTLEDALELAPHDPDVLVALGELKLHELFDFMGALELGNRALSLDPTHPGALAILAGVALRDLDFAEADRVLSLGLSQNPRDLVLLSLRAGRQFLAEQPDELERSFAQIEQLSPGYALAYGLVAELGDFEHRFSDVTELLRRGVQRDRDDPHLRAELGLNLSRSGSDAAGLLELQRAFELDPYNRRVFNSLELYEKVLPRDYDEFEAGHFRFRFPKSERALLERYVPRWVEAAFATYRKYYGFEPVGRISLELYQDRQDFSVRTSGLPEVGLEGVCFGRKIASVSPKAGAANVGMTLWHEMAHVFHLGLSKNRVPRWLTEGLAEWETDRLGRGWVRGMDRDLYQALRGDRIPKLGTMNRAFTRVESVRQVGLAYETAGQLATFLNQEDSPRTLAILSELGEKRPLREVLEQKLGPDLSAVDTRFSAWLGQRLRRFDGQFLSSLTTNKPAPGSNAPCKDTADSPVLTLPEVRSLLERDDPKCFQLAEKALERLFLSHPEPESALLWARFLEAKGELGQALDVLALTSRLGPDGIELQLAQVRLGRAQKQPAVVRAALERALQLDPESSEAWVGLAQTENEEKHPERELDALTHLLALGETNPVVHERYLTLILDFPKKLSALAKIQAAENAIWVGLNQPSMHSLAAAVYRLAGRPQEARYEDETLQLLNSLAAAR